MTKLLKRHFTHPKLAPIISIATLLVLIGTIFYHLVEKISWLDSAYLSVMTLTTVGYGDELIQSATSKLFTMAFSVVGVTVLAAAGNFLVHKAAVKYSIKKKDEESNHDKK